MQGQIEPEDVVITDDIRGQWQNIVNILIKIMKVPAALIMRVNFPSFIVFQSGESAENPFKANQEFKLPAGIYCEKTMEIKDKLLVPNALKDAKWKENPGAAVGMISYLGFPIFYPDKKIFGTLCVLDSKENTYSKDLENIMFQFKKVIESHLELLWQRSLLINMLEQHRATEKQLKQKIANLEEDLRNSGRDNK